LRHDIQPHLPGIVIPPPAGSETSIAVLSAIARFIEAWKEFNATLRKLNALGDRELADLGIRRSDIPRVAWDISTD
jgi:uncharacterized protein YjiS (DUF1127 family)